MTKVKTVIFDMDGLMFDTEKIYYKANQETADELGMDYSFDVYKQFIGSGDADLQDGMRAMYDNHELLNDFFVKSNKMLVHLLLNGPVDKKTGLIELLEYLQDEGIPAVVASSTPRKLVDPLLERLEVRKYFKEVVGGNEVPKAKPDPAIFNKAFEKTGIKDKKEALILEDSRNGIRAAYGANIPVILIPDMIQPDSEIEAKTVAVMPNLHHVIEFIEEKNKKN